MELIVARFSPLVVTGTFCALALGLASGCADVPEVRPVDGLGEAEQPIINGIVDTTHQAVVFVYGNGNGCSGTIIHKTGNVAHVLTAAHCGAPQQVLQGNDSSNPAYVYPVLDYQMHPSYTSAPLHDFMVVRVGGAGSYTPVIPAMTSSQDNLGPGTQVRHVGYGLAGPAPGTSTDLRHYFVGPLSSVQPLTINYNQPNGGPCSGDSGGPQLTTSGTELVAGVTSTGDQNCNVAGTSGRVSAVYDSFIMAYINGTPIQPMTCDQCQQVALNGQGACVGAIDACSNHTECNALMDCINACTTSTCVQNCANQHPSGISLYNAIATCICDTGCVSECAGDALCQGGSSSSSSTSTSSSSTSTSGTGGAGTGGETTSSGVGGGTTSSGDPNADSWVAGGVEEQKYGGTIVQSTCTTSAPGRTAADLLWVVALGWTVAAGARRRSRRS